ncbi:MAG TPA: hypothetical protein VEC12_10580, partial [Bacteroidia bacterium]|nr:hypothetical protein [Bacteroidia bacterium]
MNPNFNLDEAQQMLALSYAADLLGPKSNGKGGTVTMKPTSDPGNPLPNDDGKHYPYPQNAQNTNKIWPAGWAPGTPYLDKTNPWGPSIMQADPKNIPPILADLKIGANNVLFAKNNGSYVIAFAGTENLIGAVDDVSFVSVNAGPLKLTYNNVTFYESPASYIINPDYYNQGSDVTPKVIQPMMHFGFRVAVEQYTVKAATNASYNLINAMKSAFNGQSSVNLYITGHSLGAAMAGVFTAWLQAGGLAPWLPNVKLNIKTYTFASPKWANDALAENFDNGITKNGYFHRVVNNLDSVPQIPPTWESAADLNNPAMVKALLPKLPDVLNPVINWASKYLG